MSDAPLLDADLFAAASPLMGGYRPAPGMRDEMIDEQGGARPHWRAFVEALARLGPTVVARRFDGAARHLREADVFYRVFEHGVSAARPWPLSGAPVVLSAQDWRDIAEGVTQRARLLEHVLRDAYGAQNLVKDGHLPAAVIAGSPDFLRPMVGAHPKGGRFLRFYAADLGRDPDGRWRVLSDRAQAPSGAGFALENRIVLARALPEAMRDLDIERLAGFFDRFRSSLAALGDNGRICMLTPGAMSETYFEHAYLARYLGLPLVEGEDLIVRHDKVYLRTIAGLRRADVFLRRLDADFADPLALNAASRIGAPGIARAAREGHVALANALGAGLVESRALMSFLPTLSERVFGEALKLPNIATWWCGQNHERDRVAADFDTLAIAPAFTNTSASPFERGAVAGADLTPAQRETLLAKLKARGMDYVGQEVAKLSTTPIWREGRFTPRPFMLRVFVAAVGDDDWIVMPGGFARVSENMRADAVGMQYGGASADVWVMSDTPVEQKTLLTQADDQPIRRHTPTLTSRAADNLFWLGRYLERAETVVRLSRAITTRAAERDRRIKDVNQRMARLLMNWGAADGEVVIPLAATRDALARNDLFCAAPALAFSARITASNLRDRLSPDAWRAIADLSDLLNANPNFADSDALDRANTALRILSAFSGLVQENMTRGEGWLFLEIGRRIERAINVSRCARALADEAATPAAIDALLEIGDSQITYAQRYFLTSSRASALDLLVLDPSNPRSCGFQVERLYDYINRLPGHRAEDVLTPSERIVERLRTDLHVADARRVDDAFLIAQENALMELSNTLSERFLINRNRLDLEPEDEAL
jgi:uncharacterized circularly permuted ATP-grasp superfamily protein/uncharacterized alpha-E superfamily protein